MIYFDRKLSVKPPKLYAQLHTEVQVAACVVRNSEGRVLMARRRADQSSAGFWEVPGGKAEKNEHLVDAARRELLEETGVHGQQLRLIADYDHDFPTKRIRLCVFEAGSWAGQPSSQEGQELAWVDPSQPSVGPILPSNLRLLARLALPRRIMALEPPLSDSGAWAERAASVALCEGAGAVMLKTSKLPVAQQFSLSRRLNSAVRSIAGGVVWDMGARSDRACLAPVFSNASNFGERTRSQDPLRATVVPVDVALSQNSLAGYDVVIVDTTRATTSSDKQLRTLARLHQTIPGATYVLVHREHHFSNEKPDEVYGVCLLDPVVHGAELERIR